jgi:hypothetical protein
MLIHPNLASRQIYLWTSAVPPCVGQGLCSIDEEQGIEQRPG